MLQIREEITCLFVCIEAQCNSLGRFGSPDVKRQIVRRPYAYRWWSDLPAWHQCYNSPRVLDGLFKNLIVALLKGTVTPKRERFLNLKAEWFWSLRERLQAGQVRGLSDELTLSQLALIRYKPNARGQIVIESKEELLRRGVKSPDRADSVMLAFAVRQDPVDALIEYTFRGLEGGADPALADQPPALGDNGNPIWESYQRTGIKTQNRLAKLRDRSRSPADSLSHLAIQQCPRCSQVPSVYEQATYNNGVPLWHQNCRPKGRERD